MQIVVPTTFQIQLYLGGHGAQWTSDSQTLKMMGDGVVQVSFTWQQNYLYRVTTTQAGCTVKMSGVTMTENSQANHAYEMASIYTSMPYEVSKSGYYTESGTLGVSNTAVTITLTEIVQTTETIDFSSLTFNISNQTNSTFNSCFVTINLKANNSTIATWTGSGGDISAYNSKTVTATVMGASSATVQTNSNMSLETIISGGGSGSGSNSTYYYYDLDGNTHSDSLTLSGGIYGANASLGRIEHKTSSYTYGGGTLNVILN